MKCSVVVVVTGCVTGVLCGWWHRHRTQGTYTQTNDAINKTWHISCARTVEVRLPKKMASRFLHIGNKNVLSHRNGIRQCEWKAKSCCDRPDGVMWLHRCICTHFNFVTSEFWWRKATMTNACLFRVGCWSAWNDTSFSICFSYFSSRSLACVLAYSVHSCPYTTLQARNSCTCVWFTMKYSLNTLRFDHNLINLFYNFHKLSLNLVHPCSTEKYDSIAMDEVGLCRDGQALNET